jgi:4,5-dihydroxyphthalate decarboxylase
VAKKLHLTLACGDYELTRPLQEGRVEPDGIELTALTRDRDRIFYLDRRNECDVAEFNLIHYFRLRDQGEPLTAIPIFPHRRFRHGFVFVNTQCGIERPADLIGKPVGVRGYQPAAAIWIRGILQEFFDVPYQGVSWVDLYGVLGDGLQPDSNAHEEAHQERSAVDDMFLAGELVAVVSAGFPPAFLRGDRRVARLFPDYQQQEIEYYQKTGIFPIMHTVTIRQEIVDRHPWVCASLAQAFEEAKRLAYERVRNPRVVPLAFFQDAWEHQQELLGPDPWAYGLGGANRKNLETALRYAHEQGLVSSRPALSELFVDVGEAALHGGTPGY